MISIIDKRIRIRLIFASLLLAVFCIGLEACTVKRTPVESGTVPDLAAPTPAAQEYGKLLYAELISDYKLDSGTQKKDELLKVFDHLTEAAGVEDLPWHVYVFNGPEIVDVRAVYGNYIFIWTGIFDALGDEDELAGVLACELAHVLARHTDPVEFTLTSEVLFGVTELATSIGLMVASQGAITVGGHGWMKWAYVEIADLDPLDREYSEAQEREAASIAFIILSRTNYSPQALVNLWKRIAEDESSHSEFRRMSRSLSPRQRAAMLESLIMEFPGERKQLANRQTQF